LPRNTSGLQGYLSYLAQVAQEAKALLKEDGALWVHTDWRNSAAVRGVMDQVLGRDRLVNEIIWSYQTNAAQGNYFARRHDTILLYSKGSQLAFYQEEVGMPRGRDPRGHLRRGEEDGRVYFALQQRGREYRYYEDDILNPGDVWTDVTGMRLKEEERTGFEAQRPQALVERMLLATTKRGDHVADFFVGSGTTAQVAAEHGRVPLCSDRDPMTRHLFRRRMILAGGGYLLQPTDQWMVPGLKIQCEVKGSRVYLGGYYLPGGEKYIAHSLLPDYCSLVDYWAVGAMEGDTFRVRKASLRTQEHPVLEEYLDGVGADLAFMIADVYGNETYWQIVRGT